jgi:hypothetical protein
MINLADTRKSLLEMRKFNDHIISEYAGMSSENFSLELKKISRICVEKHTEEAFSRTASGLASTMMNKNKSDFAGIIMSTLCKINEAVPSELEKYAKKGYEIAKSNGDYVHMMARLNNLRKIYTRNPQRFKDYLGVLFEQERCLNELTTNYAETKSKHRTVFRPIADKDDYEQMLAYVQTEIGKLTRSKSPNSAVRRLKSAKRIFSKNENYQSVEYIDLLLNKIANSKGANHNPNEWIG